MSTSEAVPARPILNFQVSPGLCSWMAEQQLSLAFTTYQSSRLFLLGLDEADQLVSCERRFTRCMGLFCTDQTLWIATEHQVWRLENGLSTEGEGRYDRVFVPRQSLVTGSLDAHDLVVDSSGRIVLVNTRFSCLATLDHKYHFVPIWKPSFISEIAAGDRCHLNGLALRDGVPRYATACAQTDTPEGWRDLRVGGGCVLDIPSNETILDGLCMPHSPRWYRGRLWLLDSGTGYFGSIDPQRPTFTQHVFCPGFGRGLAFHGDYAIIGLSTGRAQRRASELPVSQALKQRGATERCGLMVYDLNAQRVVHWLWIEGPVKELYDVAVLPGVRRPIVLGLNSQDLRHTFAIGPLTSLEHANGPAVVA